MRQDGGQVAVGEPAGCGGLAGRPVCRPGAVQGGELDRLGHLGPHRGDARGRGLGQPQPGAVADRQELGLGGCPRLRAAVQRAGRGWRVVAAARPAGCLERSPGAGPPPLGRRARRG